MEGTIFCSPIFKAKVLEIAEGNDSDPLELELFSVAVDVACESTVCAGCGTEMGCAETDAAASNDAVESGSEAEEVGLESVSSCPNFLDFRAFASSSEESEAGWGESVRTVAATPC